MAVNVTQKDRTLRAVIAWAETERAWTWSLLEQTRDCGGRAWASGRLTAFDQTIACCRRMLGYSGAVPSETPNQAEDAYDTTTDPSNREATDD